MTSKPNTIRIGADVGGTFTDVILVNAEGRVWNRKLPSTPPNFGEAVTRAIEELLNDAGIRGREVAEVAHGTTVATNAVIERRGARTGLITTRGFRDVLELRRIRAPQLYDLFFVKPEPLVERRLRFELSERISASGEVLASPESEELRTLVSRIREHEIESVAVCLLHSYAYPQHERAVGDYLRQQLPQLHVSLSCEVLRERREYERTATTVVNAYVRPLMRQYLTAMRRRLSELDVRAPLLIMQSAGGLTPEEDAATRPAYVLESGPAAGVLAAGFIARRQGVHNVISFDMGGTTAKASLIEGGEIAYSPEYEVGAGLSAGNRQVGGAGELIRAPTIDIAEVGAGGGSIASVDRAGGLRVGPRSAGAMPGPVCYQRGGSEPTLTDANLVLGYLRGGVLADGQVSLDLEAARRAIYDRIASPLGLPLLEAAEGIHRIANARTMRALREISTARGRDPREFVLVAFGGSGPIHAAALADELHAERVLVPPMPGLFSALGLLFSGIEHHASRSCRLVGSDVTADALRQIQQEMQREMVGQFQTEGFSADQASIRWSVDVRFCGQTSEIRVALSGEGIDEHGVESMLGKFQDEHERLYGHRSDPDNPIEIVTVRCLGRVDVHDSSQPLRAPTWQRDGGASRQAWFGRQWGQLDTAVISRNDLKEATSGPLLIDEYDSTIVVPPERRVYLDDHANVIIEA